MRKERYLNVSPIMKRNIPVAAVISTRSRTQTSLSHVLVSVLNQTFKPKRLVIYDDNEIREDLRHNEMYSKIFKMLLDSGINWYVKPGMQKGQHYNHDYSLRDPDIKEDWLWRLDDDCIPKPDVLEKLCGCVSDDVFAIGPAILNGGATKYRSLIASNKAEDIHLGLNVQWFLNDGSVKEVDHLNGTCFLYNKKRTNGYCLELSRVSYGEETMLHLSSRKLGYKVLFRPDADVYHFYLSSGGIRDGSKEEMFKHDFEIFMKKIEEFGIKLKKYRVYTVINGLGDNFVFLKILPEIMEKSRDFTVVVFTPFKGVYSEISLQYENLIIDDSDDHHFIRDKRNVYEFMERVSWNGTLEDAYRRMFDV